MDLIDPNSVQGPYSQSWKDEHHYTRVSEHGYYCSDFRFKKGMVAKQQSNTHPLQMADGLWLQKSFRNTILQQIAKSESGRTAYVPSELGYLILQQVVEAVSGLKFDLFIAKEFYAPMGLQRTCFLPLNRFNKSEVMPTNVNDFLRKQDICGYVQNETAACMGGIAGHAGLFSTADEVAAIFQMLLDGGIYQGKRYLSTKTCSTFAAEIGQNRRNAAGFVSFTGTCVKMDEEHNTLFIFLSNRLCPEAWNTRLGDLTLCQRIQAVMTQSLE